MEEGDVSDEDTGNEEEEDDDDDDNPQANETFKQKERNKVSKKEGKYSKIAIWTFQDGNSVNSTNQPKKKRRFGRSIMRSFKRKVSWYKNNIWQLSFWVTLT